MQYFTCIETKKNVSPKELFRQEYGICLQITGVLVLAVYRQAPVNSEAQGKIAPPWVRIARSADNINTPI